MKTYIFNFHQASLLNKKISLSEALLLDYLMQFFQSGASKSNNVNGKKYYWITYSKILHDIPILNFSSKRNLQRMIKGLIQKGVISSKKINNHLYLHINQSELLAQPEELNKQKYSQTLLDNALLNIKQINNNVKITTKNGINISLEQIQNIVKEVSQNIVSNLQYELCIKNMKITTNADEINIYFPSYQVLTKTGNNKILKIISALAEKIDANTPQIS